MEQQNGGSAERELATPETAVQNDEVKQDEAPSGKETETPTDRELPDDQEAMQPDSN